METLLVTYDFGEALVALNLVFAKARSIARCARGRRGARDQQSPDLRDRKRHTAGKDLERAENRDVMQAMEWALRVSETQLLQRARLVEAFEPVPRVRGGDGRLGQVFLNLLINAAQAMPEQDKERNVITVSTGRDDRGWIVVSVKDTGAGMLPDVAKRVFEPFFTTKPVGVGTRLGLSICHGIVESMGGEMRVESAPNSGSTFHVYLPIADPESDTDPYPVS